MIGNTNWDISGLFWRVSERAKQILVTTMDADLQPVSVDQTVWRTEIKYSLGHHERPRVAYILRGVLLWGQMEGQSSWETSLVPRKEHCSTKNELLYPFSVWRTYFQRQSPAILVESRSYDLIGKLPSFVRNKNLFRRNARYDGVLQTWNLIYTMHIGSSRREASRRDCLHPNMTWSNPEMIDFAALLIWPQLPRTSLPGHATTGLVTHDPIPRQLKLSPGSSQVTEGQV